MSEFDCMPEMKTGLRAAVNENRRLEHIAQLKAKIADYKPHTCYGDDHEAGCPVCADIDQMEHELSLLGTSQSRQDGARR